MNNRNYHTHQNIADAKQGSDHTPENDPLAQWHLPDEPEVLSRVKERLKSRFINKKGRTVVFWSNNDIPRWAIAAVSAVFLLLASTAFVIFSHTKSAPELDLKLKGRIVLEQTVSTQQSNSPLVLRVAEHQKGQISLDQAWKLSIAGESQISLSAPTHQKQYITLTKGFVQIEVLSNKMEVFEISSGGYRIAVRGTRFSVHREANWLRVETASGKVGLSPIASDASSQDHALEEIIPKGRGVRISIDTKNRTSYPLPPPSKLEPLQRLRWMSKHQPDLLLRYTLDLSEHTLYAPEQRAEWLRWVAEQMRKKQDLNAVSQLLYAIFERNLAGSESDLELFNAAQICREALDPTNRRCLYYYRTYLQRFPQGSWREYSLYWLALGTYSSAQKHQSLKPQQPSVLNNGIELLQQYLKLYPQGYNIHTVRHLLARDALERGQGCAAAHRFIAPNHPTPTWLQQRCPNK